MQKELNIPLTFITFAHIEGKMFTHFRDTSTFVLNDKRRWGNNTAYGALYSLQDFHYYINTLDAYMLCSMTTLFKNHIKDVHHRKEVEATPISFDNIDELERLKYRERESVQAYAYVGNSNHPKINQRLTKTNSYRVIDGIDPHFKGIIREVLT